MDELQRIMYIFLSRLSTKISDANYDSNSLLYYNLYLEKDVWIKLIDFLVENKYIKSSIQFDELNTKIFIESLSISDKGLDYVKNNTYFPSASVILSAAKFEYERSFQRANAFDVKLTALIALLAFLFPVYISLPDLDCEKYGLLEILSVLILSVPCILNIIAVIKILRIATLKPYRGIKLEEIVSNNTFSQKTEFTEADLYPPYLNAAINNQIQNEERAKNYNNTIKYIIASLVLGLLLYVAKILIL